MRSGLTTAAIRSDIVRKGKVVGHRDLATGEVYLIGGDDPDPTTVEPTFAVAYGPVEAEVDDLTTVEHLTAEEVVDLLRQVGGSGAFTVVNEQEVQAYSLGLAGLEGLNLEGLNFLNLAGGAA